MSSVGEGRSHTSKQLKYIVSGGVVVYFLDLWEVLNGIWSVHGWPARSAGLSLGLASVTFTLFLYLVVYLPRVGGVHPNYANWRHSPELSIVVPLLTTTILTGWTSLLLTLFSFSPLGLFRSLIGAVGIYALSFGLIGLIPVPDRL